MTQSADNILEVEHVYRWFGGVRAVDDLSFEVPRGQVTGLIGPNGAGKSTAIEVISGFFPADRGVVRFDGTEVQGWPPHRVSRSGLIRTFQLPREWAGLTVMENMLLAAPDNGREGIIVGLFQGRQLKAMADEDRERAREILERFTLIPLKNELAGRLSGGQKRLLEFARIAMARPKMVILDEPMGGVNPVLGQRMGDAIVGMREQGLTVLVVEHNLPFIERVCDTVVVMASGRRIAEGPYDTLRNNPEVVDAYLGEVAVND